MNSSLIKVLKYCLTSIFLIISLSGCGGTVKSIVNQSPFYHKDITGSNDFNSLVENLVQKQESRMSSYVSSNTQEVVLVPDFVNVDKLENRSKLGFLLSEQLKNSLSSRGIIIKEIVLGKDFQLGKHGFNLLTREQKDIKENTVDNSYAFVGTYSVTTENLIVFIKLIDINSGNILTSAYSKTPVDDEIKDLENNSSQPLILAPMVL